MATDATGTPTSPDNIPKFNTAVDAPSGLGFNAAMDAIQVALTARPKVTTSALSGGPPGTPADKDVWIATGVDGAGARWQFQYNAGSASAFKWEFIGGSPAHVYDVGPASVAALNQIGATGWYFASGVTVARAGDYACWGSAQGAYLSLAAQASIAISDFTFAPTVGRHDTHLDSTDNFANLATQAIYTGITAGHTLGLVYAFNNTWTMSNAAFFIQPIRIS